MKKFRLGIIFSLAMLPLVAGVSFAADESAVPPVVNTAQAADACGITSADINAISDAAAQGFSAELSARKALLERTISCAKAEASSLKAALDKMKVQPGDGSIQSQLSGKLDDAMNYYDIELAKVQDAGLAGTRGIAREVLDWRNASYAIISGQTQNFMLYEQNQPVFQTAQNRFSQIRTVVSVIEQTGQNSDLEAAFSGAESLMQGALNQNAAARDALVRMLPPDQSLASIKQSLDSLSDAYKKFFDVSGIVQTLLATKEK